MKGPIRFGVTLLFPLAATSAAYGYEKDVHFSLTYAICLVSGCTSAEALEIASADERIDENDSTVASTTIAIESGSLEALKRKRWHALDDSREAVLARCEVLWQRAVESRSLVHFGQYLHYLQDSFSHREAKGEAWKPYGWSYGHALRAHQPDRVPDDRKLAVEMAQATRDAAERFLAEAFGREPKPMEPEVPAKLIESLAGAHSRDSLGFWNEADSYKVPIKLEEALLDMGYAEAHIPHVGRIIKMKFDKDGARIVTQSFR